MKNLFIQNKLNDMELSLLWDKIYAIEPLNDVGDYEVVLYYLEHHPTRLGFIQDTFHNQLA